MSFEAGVEAEVGAVVHDVEDVIEDLLPAHHDDIPMDDSAIPVKLVGTEAKTPEHASFQTWTLTGSENPVQILPQTRRRHRATIVVAATAAAGGPATTGTIANAGTVVAAVGQVGNIVDLSPLGADVQGIAIDVTISAVSGVGPSSTYQLQASADSVNWEVLATSAAQTAAGTFRLSSQGPLDRYVRLYASAVQATTTATLGAVWTAAMFNENTLPQSVKIGQGNQISNNQGATLTAPLNIIYEAGTAVWLIPQASNGNVQVTIIDEWYAE